MCTSIRRTGTSYGVSGYISRALGVVGVANSDVTVDVQNSVNAARRHDSRDKVKAVSVCVVFAVNWTCELRSGSSLEELSLNCNHQLRVNSEVDIKPGGNVQ
jgi:hypothetical protein